MSLHKTQEAFCHALISKDWENESHAAEQLIRHSGDLSPRERLAIYRNTGLTARINALRQIYPACESILGERMLAHLAHNYALKSVSHSSDLNTYGGSFTDFIALKQAYTELDEYAYLSDLCRLEWLWHAIYYRENDQPFDFKTFEKYCEQPANVVLTLSHALELMSSDYPVYLIWQQHRSEQPSDVVAGLLETDYLCIYREEFVPKVEKISPSLYRLLGACRQGRSLQALSLDSQLAEALSELPALIKRGWISGFTITE